MTHLLITVHWLDDRYHGLLDREGPPEWPPSPYRLFQALVAGVARRGELEVEPGKALGWLQTLKPPTIIAPRSRPGQVVTHFVPNNDGDKKPNRQDRLTGKTFHPTIMLDPPDIHYLWEITSNEVSQAEAVCAVACYLTCLGWGIDMAYADGQLINRDQIAQLSGMRWYPRKNVRRDDGVLRVPTFDREPYVSSLSDLKRAHQSALNRIKHGEPLNAVEKPKAFDRVFYESTDRLLGRPYEVFELRRDDGAFFLYPQEKLIHLAGMIRHLAIEAMEKAPPNGISDDWIETYVAGHAKIDGIGHRQFSYLPLPSIGHQHADHKVRRVMITAPTGDDRLLQHLARKLNGLQLKPTAQTNLNHPPTLVRIRQDKVARLYTQSANLWASVTPVILPGHDDHKPDKTRKLIEKAFAQSGVDLRCEFEWSAFSEFPNSLSAHKYGRGKRPIGYVRPSHLLSQTAVHLKLRFQDGLEVPGPLAIGAGRHCGLGVFARVDGAKN
ncbi:MAG: type I-U CRISPR-associated protein Cas5/Cas6 [Nitrospira sp. WS238]|nr:type I-U CRISPR-associated protein Cas5/Cas6 [Nitrospira sp. WS238]